jgi:hypothetical protein
MEPSCFIRLQFRVLERVRLQAQQYRNQSNSNHFLYCSYAYCVGLTTTSVTTQTSSTPPPTTVTPVPAPGPTQANSIPSNCNKYAMAPAGSWCAKFAEDEGISLANLYAWNAVLGPNGENCGGSFWANTYYCTGVSS